MVANAVPVLGRVVSINFSRCFLFRAADAYERGEYILAGVLFREALRRQLWAECEWHGVLPESASEVTPPRELLKAARRGGLVTDDVYTVVKEMIGIGNATAHCRRFEPRELHASILLLFDIIDASPYMQPANAKSKPLASSEPQCDLDCCDDDDDDGADWWKIGGAA